MIDSKMVADDNINLTELNRNFNEIDPHAPLRDEDGIGVGDSNKLSNKISERVKYLDSKPTITYKEECELKTKSEWLSNKFPKTGSQKISQKK